MTSISDIQAPSAAAVEQSMREILQAESRAILNIPVTEAYARSVRIILDRVHA